MTAAVELLMGIDLGMTNVKCGLKHCETTLIEGARQRDRRLLLHALMIHPLIGSHSLAVPFLEDILAGNREFLPPALGGRLGDALRG